MNIHKMTSVAMVAVAAAGLSLPTTSPAVAEVKDQRFVTAKVPSNYKTIEEVLNANWRSNKTIVVELDPNAGPYELPLLIEKGFKEVQIVSAEPKSAKKPRLVQPVVDGTPEASVSFVPLVVEGVKVENVRGTVFGAAHSLTIVDVEFDGNGIAVHADRHLNDKFLTSKDKNAKFNASTVLEVMNSKFNDVEIANINHAFKSVNIFNNVYSNKKAEFPNAVTLGPVSYGNGKAVIADNQFFYSDNASAVGSSVTIMRPNVTLKNNLFSGVNNNVSALEVIVPRYKGRPNSNLVHNVLVDENIFDMNRVFVHRDPIINIDKKQLESVVNNPDLHFITYSRNFFSRIKWEDSKGLFSLNGNHQLGGESETRVGENAWDDGDKTGLKK